MPTRALAALCLAFLLSACGNPSYRKGQAALLRHDYRSALTHLVQAEKRAPQDPRIKREIGGILVSLRYYPQAIEKLEQAFGYLPNDLTTIFYLALAHEMSSNYEEAIMLYDRYAELSDYQPARLQIRARGHSLRRRRAAADARLLADRVAAGEEPPGIRPNTLAVLYFGDDSGEDRLGKGLARLLSEDLRRLDKVQVVDRIRMQRVVEALKIDPTTLADPKAAQRLGRMLSTERVIFGSVTRTDAASLAVSAEVMHCETGKMMGTGVAVVGEIAHVLHMERKLLFGLLHDLEIEIPYGEMEVLEGAPHTSVDAFLAYCRGLELEDQKRYGAAREQYALAPGFALAAERLDILSTEILGFASLQPIIIHDASFDPMASRLVATELGLARHPGLGESHDVSAPRAVTGKGTLVVTGRVPD